VIPQQAEAAIKEALAQVAPDADTDALAPDADLRETLELDSIDFLRFIEILSKNTGSRIDEDDYPQLNNLAAAVTFITERGSR
jgi:acyl carrier protein